MSIFTVNFNSLAPAVGAVERHMLVGRKSEKCVTALLGFKNESILPSNCLISECLVFKSTLFNMTLFQYVPFSKWLVSK